MDLRRIVRLSHLHDPNHGGTGYLVTGNRILTSRHVVLEAGHQLLAHFDDLAGQPQLEKDVGVEWQGPDGWDVAVLALGKDLRLARQRLQLERWETEERWSSRGWARVTVEREDQGVVANMTGLLGLALPVPFGAAQCELTSEATTGEIDDWRGISGAPVFIAKRLAAVVAELPDDFDGKRIFAIPLAFLIDLPGFREALGIGPNAEEEAARRRTELLDGVARQLDEAPEAAQALTAECPELTPILKRGARNLAEALVSMPWRRAVSILNEAHKHQHERSGEKALAAAESLARVTERILPEIYASTELQLLAGTEGGRIVTLPVENQTLAELAMAALDNRPLAFREASSIRHFPLGRARFALAQEQIEAGFDFHGEAAFRAWLLQLASYLGMDPAVLRTLQAPEREDELVRAINRDLDLEVKEDGEPRRYFLFTADFARASGAFLRVVEERLPALHLVQISRPEDAVAELDDIEPLKRILFRSTQSKKRRKRRPE